MYDRLEYPLVKALMESHLGNLQKDAELHRIIKESSPSTGEKWTRLKRFTAKVTAYLRSFSLNVSDVGTRIN